MCFCVTYQKSFVRIQFLSNTFAAKCLLPAWLNGQSPSYHTTVPKVYTQTHRNLLYHLQYKYNKLFKLSPLSLCHTLFFLSHMPWVFVLRVQILSLTLSFSLSRFLLVYCCTVCFYSSTALLLRMYLFIFLSVCCSCNFEWEFFFFCENSLPFLYFAFLLIVIIFSTDSFDSCKHQKNLSLFLTSCENISGFEKW